PDQRLGGVDGLQPAAGGDVAHQRVPPSMATAVLRGRPQTERAVHSQVSTPAGYPALAQTRAATTPASRPSTPTVRSPSMPGPRSDSRSAASPPSGTSPSTPITNR